MLLRAEASRVRHRRCFGPCVQVVSESGHTIGNPAPVVDRLSNPGDDVITLLYSRDNHQVSKPTHARARVTWHVRRAVHRDM